MADSAQGIRGIKTLPQTGDELTDAEETWVTTEAALGISVNNETPSGAIDGANKTYTLANTPISGSVRLYINGFRYKENSDFTMSGATITITGDALEVGMNILADYKK